MEAIADIAALFLFLIGVGGMGMFARFVGSLLEPAIPLTLDRTQFIISVIVGLVAIYNSQCQDTPKFVQSKTNLHNKVLF